MIDFEYVDAKSLDELKASLTDTWDDVAILAGGTDVLDRIKERLLEPRRVVNIKGIPELGGIRNGNGLTIGPLTTMSVLASDDRIAKSYPVLQEAAHAVATPQLRNMGTLGGNLCQRPRCWYYRNSDTPCLKSGGAKCWAFEGLNKYHAIFGGGPSYIVHPSDTAPALQALDAKLEIVGAGGTREVGLDEFYQLPTKNTVRESNLEANEVITKVKVPALAKGTRSTYLKFREKQSLDFAVSSVAAVLTLDGSTVKSARIVLGGVAPVPWRSKPAEDALTGKKLDDASITAAAEAAVDRAKPLDHNAFKVPLTRNLVRRALESLAS